MSGVILDNDVLLKAAAWLLAAELTVVLKGRGGPHVVAVTAIVTTRQIQRSRRIVDKRAASEALSSILSSCTPIEPTPEEMALAAELEAFAQDQAISLDSGESLIAAIAASRAAASMLTGDKRAIAALEIAAAALGLSERLSGKVACLEQLISAISRLRPAEDLRSLVCAEPEADSAMRIVFKCGPGSPLDSDTLMSGLNSYIEHIRRSAPTLLISSDSV